MYSLGKITGNTSSILITIFLLAVIIVTLPAIMTTTEYQSCLWSTPDQMNSTVADSSPNIQNIPIKNLHV